MKLKPILAATAMAAFIFCLNSCKKADVKEEFETTFELSSDQAISDNLTQDANDVFMQVAVENNVAGGNFAPGPVTSAPNGVVRSGKINITLSDSVRKPGSIAVMTFDNYYVSGYKVEGTYTWKNTSTANTRSWERKTENGKVTAPGGRYWLHEGLRNVVQTGGVNTPLNLTDDVFSVTGNHRVTNAAGAYRDITVMEALQKKNSCSDIDKGKLKVQGPNHYAIINFGDGTCDNLATLSIDGMPERVIILR